MKKSQFIDGARGPQFAKHISHTPGVNRSLKAEASRSVRRAFKHEIDAQLEEDDEFLEPLRTCPDYFEYDYEEDEPENFASTVALISRLMAYEGLALTDIEFVTDGAAWCTWDELVAMCTGSIYPPVYGLKLVGNGWFCQRCDNDGDMYWSFHRMPVRPAYHTPLAFMPDIRVQ
jgi:hypothetical protein